MKPTPAILGSAALQPWAEIAQGDAAALLALVQALLGPRHPPWLLLDALGERVAGVEHMAHPGRMVDLVFGGRREGCLLLAEATPLLHSDASIAGNLGLALSLLQRARVMCLQQERFRLIAQVAALVSVEGDLDRLLGRAADLIHERLGYPNVDIPLLDAEREELVVRIRGGHYKMHIQGEDRLPLTQGVMGRAVTERRTQRVNDTAGDPRYCCPPGVTPARAELAVPIVHGAEVLGVLNVEGQRPFDDLDSLSMEIIAEHLAGAIVTARMQARARQVAVLDERQRLARELHDNVTQLLSSISLMTQSLGSAWIRNPLDGAKRTQDLQELVRLSLLELRALLRQLQPEADARRDSPQQPLGELLQGDGLAVTLARLARVAVPQGLRLQLDFEGYRRQHPALEETLLRISQEAISNVIRHARARCLSLSLHLADGRVKLVVVDDGRGIDHMRADGMGLRHMQQRATEAGGHLLIEAMLPHGTRITALLPARPETSGAAQT